MQLCTEDPSEDAYWDNYHGKVAFCMWIANSLYVYNKDGDELGHWDYYGSDEAFKHKVTIPTKEEGDLIYGKAYDIFKQGKDGVK